MDPESPGEPPDPPDPMDIPHPCPSEDAKSERAKKRSAETPSQSHGTKRVVTEPDYTIGSIQNVYTHASVTITDKTYGPKDVGPFFVHITIIEPDPSAGLSLRPIKIGLIMAKNNINNIVRDGVKAVGRNRVAVEFKHRDDANSFLHHPCLKQNQINAIIPTYHVTRMGLLRGVPKEWSMTELAEAIKLPENCGIVLKARRLNRKVISEGTPSWVPTQSVVVTFSGQVLPKNVYVYYTSIIVEKYLMPTIQCHNCCRFGHVKTQCRSKPRCFKCSQEHSGDTCQATGEFLNCTSCSGKHQATYKDCPEHQRQRNIKLIMTDNNISYIEASNQIPAARRSYADTAAAMFAPTSQPNVYKTPTNLTYKSYKKTVFTNPRSRPPPTKGYDRQGHSYIINTPAASYPNGCAFEKQSVTISNEDLIEILVTLLNNCILKPNNNIPNNVASKIDKLTELFQSQNGSNTPVEQQEC